MVISYNFYTGLAILHVVCNETTSSQMFIYDFQMFCALRHVNVPGFKFAEAYI